MKDASQRSCIEACGVLVGQMDETGNWYIEQALPLRNRANSSVYFEFDPEELLAAELSSPGQLVGVYHSHPAGFPVASDIDRENMRRVNLEQQIPWVWLIISGPFDEQFRQQALEGRMIAYHHYEREGLCEVRIQLEAGAPETIQEDV
ncbi:MAG: Mov34/MPN/PAD-1 family protein [Ktedonobacteraceae bacterium]|nr:Mov34/MPN/PAD-1 family protein [Ktedonobacteraceae bacterium]